MWIGVDFDGTLAHSVSGEPIPLMVERVRKWLRQDQDVRIFTARAAPNSGMSCAEIDVFCIAQFGKTLPITCVKDKYMAQLYDDRAIAIDKNTGAWLLKEPEDW